MGRAVRYLREQTEMTIVLVEQSFDSAHALGNAFVVLERAEVVAGAAAARAPGALRGRLPA
jgi:urea transport system ATP-binding protein